jgi:hypothetical protein
MTLSGEGDLGVCHVHPLQLLYMTHPQLATVCAVILCFGVRGVSNCKIPYQECSR